MLVLQTFGFAWYKGKFGQKRGKFVNDRQRQNHRASSFCFRERKWNFEIPFFLFWNPNFEFPWLWKNYESFFPIFSKKKSLFIYILCCEGRFEFGGKFKKYHLTYRPLAIIRPIKYASDKLFFVESLFIFLSQKIKIKLQK